MATAGNTVALTTDEATMISAVTDQHAIVVVDNYASSAGRAVIQCPRLHGTAWRGIAPGVSAAIKLVYGDSLKAKAVAIGGGAATATIDWGMDSRIE